MQLQHAYEKYYGLLKKGIEEGLTHQDYLEVLSMSKLTYENDLYKKYWVALIGDINYLLEDLRMDSKITSEVSPACMEYILNNCYLLPLVLANRLERYAKPFEEGSYLFNCQFHEDEYPSLEVKDYSNKYKCFACGEEGNVISYLKMIENLRKDKIAIALLIRIYLLDDIYLSSHFNSIALKYRDTITSDQFKRLLERGYTLFKANNILSIDGYFIDKLYEDRFYTIHRLENHEKDEFFKYEPNDTYRLKLSKEEYKPFMDRIEKR